MLSRLASSYFSARSRQSWRTLGYGAMAVPLLSLLHAPAIVLALAVTAFAYPAARNLVESHRERNGDKAPTKTIYPAKSEDRRELGMRPFGGLFEQWQTDLSFEDMVTEAAAFSNEYGRRLAVICVRIPNLPPELRADVFALLRHNIRQKDEVELVSDEEFMVCAHLLRDGAAADTIANRLMRALRGTDRIPASLPIHLGKAIFPAHGYTGADLAGHARDHLCAVERKPARLT